MHAPHPQRPANGSRLRLGGVNFKRVLVPVDFSAGTLEGLRYAKVFGEKFDAIVDVLHVVQLSVDRNEATLPRTGLIRTMSEDARQELKRLVAILWENEIEATVAVREGRADEVIVHEACSNKSALIIMGTRNHSWLSGVLRRNTVKHVIQSSPCPVVVLRSGMAGSGANCNSRSESSFESIF